MADISAYNSPFRKNLILMPNLIPEKPLLISPALAATIGLEEACMLSVLGDAAGFWAQAGQLRLGLEQVRQLMPFWNDYDVQRISKSLQDRGIIQLESAPFTQSQELRLVFAAGVLPDRTIEQTQPIAAPKTNPGANLIADNWQPDEELVKLLIQHHGISREFIWEQVPSFVYYWKERREARHSWGSSFQDHVLHEWRKYEEDRFRKTQESPMYTGWRPSDETMKMLLQGSQISSTFIEDAIAEFVIYWKEKGDHSRTWNSQFIQHVKRQWPKFKSSLEQDKMPRELPADWQPSKEVFEVLKMAKIDANFAQTLLPEFILFWRDSKQVHASWNTKFLQHVKYVWAKQHAMTPFNSQQVNQDARQSTVNPTASTRDRSLVQDLTDRSWAS